MTYTGKTIEDLFDLVDMIQRGYGIDISQNSLIGLGASIALGIPSSGLGVGAGRLASKPAPALSIRLITDPTEKAELAEEFPEEFKL